MGKCECNKKHVTLIWALLECLFFAGIVFGWSWLSATLRRDEYFLDVCNTSINSEGLIENSIKENVQQPKSKSPHEFNFDPRETVKDPRRLKRPRKIKCKRKKIKPTTPDPTEQFLRWKVNDTQYFCDEQEDNLELMNAIVIIIRNALILPIGFFLDSYGTTRTRLLSVLAFVMGTLMMTFSSASFPWLIIPAFSLLSWAGLVILITNLQIANLFGAHRYTAIASMIGAFHASSLILHLVKLTQYDIETQTSFMFLTIGVIPILVSTIAFLPKSKIPWPLPASYGKRGQHGKDPTTSLSRQKKKIREEFQTFVRIARSSMFIWSVVWYCIYHLRAFTYDGNLRYMLVKYGVPNDKVHEYTDINALVQMIALPVGPLLGYFVDWRRASTFVTSPAVQQMHSVLVLTGFTFLLALTNNILPTIPSVSLQVAGFCFQIIERVAVLTSMFSFLMHVHFPVEHFGKLIGFHFTMSSIISLLRFPFQKFVITSLQGDPFYINLLLLVFLLISCGHPVNVWYHCKLGLINDSTTILATQAASERLMAARPSEAEVEITTENIQHA